MKEPFVSRRRRSNQSNKLILVCSFNGTFQPRPPSGELRYTGGETRIVSVDRNAGFSRLKSKISELICPSNGLSFSLKYQLPGSGAIGGDAPLVLITSDDDVRWMIDEYDKLESSGKPSRLWIFVCNDSGVVNGHTVTNDVSLNYLGTESLNDRAGVSISYKGSGGDTRGTFVKTVADSLCGDGFESRNSVTNLYGGEAGGHKVDNSASVAGYGNFDGCLMKVALKRQLLRKALARSHCFQTASGFPVVQNNLEFAVHGSQSSGQPFINLISEPQSHLSRNAANPDLGGDSYGVNMLDYKSTNTHLPGSQTFGNFTPLQVAHSLPLSPKDGNPYAEVSGSKQYLLGQSGGRLSNRAGTGSGSSIKCTARAQLSKQSCSSNPNVTPANCDSVCALQNIKRVPLSNLNRGNIMPWAANCESAQTRYESVFCSNQLVGSVYPAKSIHSDGKVSADGSIHDSQFGTIDARNQITCPYYVQNHQTNLCEMENHRNVEVDRRSWVGKFYPGLKSNSSISKPGQVMRSYGPTLRKPFSGYHGNTLEGVRRIVNSGLINQTYAIVHPCGSKEKIKDRVEVPGHETPTPTGFDLCYHDKCTGMGEQSLPSVPSMEGPSKYASAMKTREYLLCGSSIDKHEVPCQAACKNFQEVPMNVQPICYDMKDEMCLKDLLEDVSISGFSNNLGSKNGTVTWCDGNLPDVEAVLKSFGNHQKSSHTLKDGIAYSVDLSLCNLSLSSSKEVEPLAHSSHASNDVSEALLMPQSKTSDLMDEDLLNFCPQVEKPNGFTSNSSCQMAANLEADKQEFWLVSPSSLITVENADIEKSQKLSKVKGGIPRDLAAFYTHLATRELQTIKHSDLEYIKQLGSGTYGAVFYGKWKGSDVAIKRIKPTCFTVDALEENRVVADFLKEAHLLAQLHHPNIVAFYGVAKEGPITDLATVTEYMVNGSLKQVLRKRDRTIDRRKRLIIGMDAAFGMEYLHEKNIVHFDLKSHNFLVNMRDPQRPVCKIGDLGLSKIKERTLVSGGVRGTIPWMAPELLNSENNMVSEKVDVYSFGIVMWELLTGEEPYFNMRPEDIIAGTLKGDLRPKIPSWCDPAWKSLMESCWSSDPDSRPSFAEIARELRAMSAAMNIK